MGKVRGFLAAGMIFFACSPTWGADSTPPAKAPRDSLQGVQADRYVREALTAELAGDDARRNELLAYALSADPNCRTARWQLGCVAIDGKWFTPEETAHRYSTDRNLVEYRRRRDQAAAAGLFTRREVSGTVGGTVGGPMASQGSSVETHRTGALTPEGIAANAELARWCRSKRLADEERAHWTQVLYDDPTNSEAQSRLGLHWYQGNLLTTAQIEAIKQQRAAEEKQLSQWKPVVARWRKALNSGLPTERSAVLAEMRDAKDAAIIPALEWADASDPANPAGEKKASPFQREAVALLGRLPDQRATYSLVQHSVLSKCAEVRSFAADELKKRPLHDFVPVLLGGLANPIQFDYSLSFDPSLGLAIYRSVAVQEGRDTISRVEYSSSAAGLLPAFVGSFDSGFGASLDVARKTPVVQATSQFDPRPQTVLAGPRDLSEVAGAASVARQSQQVAASIEKQNERIALLNRRIDFVMQRVTGLKSPGENSRTATTDENAAESDAIPDAAIAKPAVALSDAWWNWWADYTETYRPEKQVSSTTYGDGSYANRSQFLSLYSTTPTRSGSGTIAFAECFVAGTPVTTLTGPVAIEKLTIGDRVLSQNAETGELAYKLVLGSTIRPPVETVLVTTSRGDIRATRGHPFWIVGKGWRMARELAVGDRLHGLQGSATVTAIKSQSSEKVYNLSVADYGTYFVGSGRILVHDNTPRLPSRAALPGFVAEN